MNLARLIFPTPLILVVAITATMGVQARSETDGSAQSETGDLKITFKFKGKPPIPEPLELPASCGNLEMTDETLIVSGNNNGIMNVVVYAHRGRDDEPISVTSQSAKIREAKKKQRTLACWNCRFVPRIVTAQKGDTLTVRNMDKIGYNVALDFFNNDSQNFAIVPGRERDLTFDQSEPAITPVAASIFPWMVGYVLVADHPFYDVSNPDGRVLIRGLPVGETITFRAWHERGTFKNRIFVNGEEDRWEANKFQVQIKAGMNDLGTVEIGPDAFEGLPVK